MFACTKDNPVDGVLVESDQPSSGPDTNAFRRVVDDLSDRLGGQMQTEQRARLCSGKTLAAGAAVKKTLSARSSSARSKEYITGTLRRILKHAYDRRMVNDAPPTGKRVGVAGPGNNCRLRVISPEEEKAIMEYLFAADEHAWRITGFCFLRRGYVPCPRDRR